MMEIADRLFMWHLVWIESCVNQNLNAMKQSSLPSDPSQVYNWNIELSNHSRQRSQQRGITKDLIYLGMDYSQAIFKQGLIFYAVIERLLPANMDHQLREKLNNLVVVFSPQSNEVVTCYKASKGIHRIKRKSKRLLFSLS
jgi:hypothetical protein